MAFKLETFRPTKGKIFVSDLERGMEITKGGIILRDDNMQQHGIKARWGKVVALGEGVDWIAVGEWVLIEHGRWTFGIDFVLPDGTPEMVWHVDDKALMVATDSDPRKSKYNF